MCYYMNKGLRGWKYKPSFASLPGRYGNGAFKNLPRRHRLKVPVQAEYSIEECCLAVGELVGYDSLKAASRVNSAAILFVDMLDKVNAMVERGIAFKKYTC